jgi:TPP-dependent pyruvate/acetoin dehydrogenase alpha subunit
MSSMSLGSLADPKMHHEPISIQGHSPQQLAGFVESLLRIRLVEQHLAHMRRDGHIGGPVHLGAGQEAVAVGVSASLRHTDRIFGGHRSHSHILAMGSSIHGLFAEVLGKDTGLSKGMGGSMHLWDIAHGFAGSVPIVAGTVPLAVGAGLAAKISGTDAVGVAYFGDGAMEEGAVHEALNLARVLELPVLFVVENNLFSSHMHISLRQPADRTARFADAHRIRSEVVDGNDVVAVADATARLVDGARKGQGPGFLEAITYRWYGHVDWRDDIDVGIARSTDELKQWKERDPMRRLCLALEAAGQWSAERTSKLEAALHEEIAVAWQRAMDDPYPPKSALLDRVYAKAGSKR